MATKRCLYCETNHKGNDWFFVSHSAFFDTRLEGLMSVQSNKAHVLEVVRCENGPGFHYREKHVDYVDPKLQADVKEFLTNKGCPPQIIEDAGFFAQKIECFDKVCEVVFELPGFLDSSVLHDFSKFTKMSKEIQMIPMGGMVGVRLVFDREPDKAWG